MRSAVRLGTGAGFTIDAVTCVDDHRTWSKPEVNSAYRLVLVRRGRFRRLTDGHPADLDPTLAYLSIPGEEEHFAHPAGGDICTSITLTPPLWHTLIQSDTPPSTLYVDAHLDLAHRRLISPSRTTDPHYALAESFLTLLTAALRPTNPPKPTPTRNPSTTHLRNPSTTHLRNPSTTHPRNPSTTHLRNPNTAHPQPTAPTHPPTTGAAAYLPTNSAPQPLTTGAAHLLTTGAAHAPTTSPTPPATTDVAHLPVAAASRSSGISARGVAAKHRSWAVVAAARDAIVCGHPSAEGLLPLSELLGVSPYQLSRAFTRELGVSLTHYRNRVRVGTALDRLEQGEPSLAALAADLGFADQAHLTRTIKQHLGHTPTAVRRLLTLGGAPLTPGGTPLNPGGTPLNPGGTPPPRMHAPPPEGAPSLPEATPSTPEAIPMHPHLRRRRYDGR